MENILIYSAVGLVLAVPFGLHIGRVRERGSRARASAEQGELFSEGPRAQHPHFNVSRCIGCGTCAASCPEGDVLGVFAGKAAIIKGHKCIGHGLCELACPVGAIEIVMADPGVAADMPRLSSEFETNIRNMFIIGELGGLALIKNAVNQGRDCIDIITKRITDIPARKRTSGIFDVCVVGAGPGGISASLRAIENGLSYITLEQDEIGGTVAKYPRQKVVMTSPVQFPLYGRFSKLEITKEDLLSFWNKICQRADLRVNTCEKVNDIRRGEDGVFAIQTAKGQYLAHTVILSLGRRGTPRKLGIKGEELPKVMYSLIEAEAYTHKKILIVGGGDSAVEAAMGLAHQPGNRVTISYRREGFSRIKERNARRIREYVDSNRLDAIFNSVPIEIREQSVLLDVKGEVREIPNDYVWIFAGGTPPNAFLQQVGIESGMRDLTDLIREEAKPARARAS